MEFHLRLGSNMFTFRFQSIVCRVLEIRFAKCLVSVPTLLAIIIFVIIIIIISTPRSCAPLGSLDDLVRGVVRPVTVAR